MKRVYEWLHNRFLPEWARRHLIRENQELRMKLEQKEQVILRLEAYIQGLQEGMRLKQRILQGKCNRKQGKEGERM